MGVKWAVKMQRKALQIGTKWAKSEVRQQALEVRNLGHLSRSVDSLSSEKREAA